MPLFNFLAFEMIIVLSGGCFHFTDIFSNFGVGDHIFMKKQFARNLVSIDLLRIGYGTGRYLQYG